MGAYIKDIKQLSKTTRKNFANVYDKYILNDLLSLLDVLSIYSLTKGPLCKYTLSDKNNYQQIYDIGSDLYSEYSVAELEQFNSFIFVGFNPRFEAPLLNICLARIRENNDSEIISYGSAVENFFPYRHKGSHTKSLMTALEGRDSCLVNSRNAQKVRVFYGDHYSNLIGNLNSISKFLGSKFYTKSSFLSSQMTTLHFLEVFGGHRSLNTYKRAFADNRIRPKKVSGWYFSDGNFEHSEPLYDSFSLLTRANTDNRNVKKRVKGLRSEIPITFFYEQHDWVVSIFGKITPSYKVANLSTTQAFSVQAWLSNFFFLSLENYTLVQRWWVSKQKERKEIVDNINSIKFLAASYFNSNTTDAEYLKSTLIDHFAALSVYNTNKYSDINNYYPINLSQEKGKLQYVQNGAGLLPSTNFFLSSPTLKYSPTMMNLSFLDPSYSLLK